MMKQAHLIPLFFVFLGLAVHVQCRRHETDSASSNPSQNSSNAALKLKEGMVLKISEHVLNPVQTPTSSSLDPHGVRTLTIDNPSDAEGLAFHWSLNAKFSENSAPSLTVSVPGGTASPSPQAPLTTQDTEVRWEGQMTLANMANAPQLTPPLFWPAGELYLSNSSALWLSDRSYEELKQKQSTQIQPGILGNVLLGPAQGLKILESSLASLNQAMEKEPEKLKAAQELKISKKKQRIKIKVNGVEQEVEVMEVQNWLARYRILDNAQNPLIVEWTLVPNYSLGELIFSPFLMIKDLLEWRVEEIVTKS